MSVLPGAPFSSDLDHYANGAVGLLEFRLVDHQGVEAIAWSALQIVQVTSSGGGPDWRYRATRLAPTTPGVYTGKWRLAASPSEVWTDETPLVVQTADISEFRLLIGDTPAAYGLPVTDVAGFEAVQLLTDEQVQSFLDRHPGSVKLAVAEACDALAARFAQEVDVAEDGQSLKLSQMAARYAELATRFREQAVKDAASPPSDAGVPIGRVPWRVATTWGERH